MDKISFRLSVKPWISLISLLLFCFGLWSAELVVKEDITLLPNDFIRTNKKDMSGRWCCLLKIANDVDGFDLVDSPLTPMYWDNKAVSYTHLTLPTILRV